MNDRPSGTLVMVRTTCCETVRETGVRCSICPHRPENVLAARECKQTLRSRQMRRVYTSPVCNASACAAFAD